MNEEDKIKITYDDLNNPKVDEIIARHSKESLLKVKGNRPTLRTKINSFTYKKWLYLILAGIIFFLILWGLIKIFESIISPKDGYNEKNGVLVMILNGTT